MTSHILYTPIQIVQCGTGKLCLLALYFLLVFLFLQTKEITNRTAFTRLFGPLEAFTTYCVYLMAQFLNREGVRSAHSQVLGPQCVNTPPGGMLFINFNSL